MNSTDPIAYWQQKFIEYLISQGPSDDGAHDTGHFKRVWKTASRINDAEGNQGDRLVLLAASYFHDLISLPKNHPDRSQSSRLSAESAAKLLKEKFSGFPDDKIYAVQQAILTHSFSAGIPPATYEAKVLQDADRMEALGAIGIARTFYTAGVMKSRLFHEDDPLGNDRELNDSLFSLDHFEVKLLKLPAMMQTEAGRKMAEQRTRFLIAFRKEMAAEILGE